MFCRPQNSIVRRREVSFSTFSFRCRWPTSISCCGTDGISALVTERNPVALTQHDLCSFCCSCFLSESLVFVKLVIGFRYSIPDIEGFENRVQGRQKPPFLLGENVSQLYCSSQLRWKKRLLSCSLPVFFSNLGEKTNSFRIPGLKWFCRSTSLLFSSKRRGSTSVLKNPSSSKYVPMSVRLGAGFPPQVQYYCHFQSHRLCYMK